MLLKCIKVKNAVMWVTCMEGLEGGRREGSRARRESVHLVMWEEGEKERERDTTLLPTPPSLNNNRGPHTDTVRVYQATAGEQPRRKSNERHVCRCKCNQLNDPVFLWRLSRCCLHCSARRSQGRLFGLWRLCSYKYKVWRTDQWVLDQMYVCLQLR